MKHVRYWLTSCSLLLVLSLAACGGDDGTDKEVTENIDPQSEEQTESENEQAESKISKDEIIEKTAEVMSTVDTYAMKTTVNQDMVIDGQHMEMTQTSEAQVNNEPLRYYETSLLQMDDEAENDIETETYLTEDGLFVKDSTNNQWMKFPNEFTEDMNHLMERYNQPEEQLEIFESFIDDFHLSEEEDTYVLSLTSSNDEIEETALQFMNDMNGEISSMFEDMLGMVDIHSLDYELKFDKDTFYQTSMAMEMKLSLDVTEGQSLETTQRMEATFTDFNEVEVIELPDEVKNNAEELYFVNMDQESEEE